MTTLTADQLVDIIFQTPDRVTAGILDRRGYWARFRDNYLTISGSKTGMSSLTKQKWEDLKRSFLLEFNETAHINEEHPQSLRKAALELKALGYSNAQIHEIKEEVYRFILAYFDKSKLGQRVKQDFPAMLHAIDDRAFLGTVMLDIEPRKSPDEPFKDLENVPGFNSAFRSDAVDMVYNMFKSSFRITARQNPAFLSPEAPAPAALQIFLP